MESSSYGRVPLQEGLIVRAFLSYMRKEHQADITMETRCVRDCKEDKEYIQTVMRWPTPEGPLKQQYVVVSTEQLAMARYPASFFRDVLKKFEVDYINATYPGAIAFKTFKNEEDQDG